MTMGSVTGKDANGTPKNMLAAVDASGNLAAATVVVNSDGDPITGHVDPDQFLAAYLVNGGSNDLTVNGSVTSVTFGYTVPANKVLLMYRILFYIEGAAAFASTTFASGPALTNGVQLSAAGVVLASAKDNADFVVATFDFEGRKNMAKEDKSGAGRWTFSSASGGPLRLIENETVEALIQDDLSSVSLFRMMIQGKLIDAV